MKDISIKKSYYSISNESKIIDLEQHTATVMPSAVHVQQIEQVFLK